MKLGLRGKLVLASVGLVALCVLAADAFLSSGLDAALTQRVREDLSARLALVSLAAERLDAPLSPGAAWDGFADELGKAARARVTVIAAGGAVLGDSEVPLERLSALEGHRDRPEVVAALSSGSGAATRLSATLGERMMYVAAPLHRGGAVVGVVRAARRLSEVDASVAALRRVLLGSSVLALGLAVLAASLAAQRMSRAVRAITAAARKMAQGDLQARSRVSGADELGELGRTLDALAQGLATTLGELRSERDLLGGVLTAMSEGVMLLDAEGRVAMMNRALRQMLLLDSSAVGKRPLEVIRRADLEEILERARRSQEPVLDEVELPGLKPRTVLVHAMRLELTSPALLVVLVDVTELRRLEAVRREFVANVSHELRTPIASVRSAAETLRSALRKDPVAAEGFAEMVERNADRLNRLVEDLLDLSRIESRQYQLSVETLELGAALEHSAAPFAERAASKGLELKVERGEAPALVRADRRALEQVVSNLVDNAVKYCPAGAAVRVRAVPEADGRVRVLVEDTGPGIEARHLPRLFERFYRVDAGRSREVGGTGLGLSIVKHLVEAMGGGVEVTSAPGKGTTFSFTLPRA